MTTGSRVEIMTLASGSSGNALYLRLGDCRLLVDAGISRQRIVKGLADRGVTIGQLDAIVVTHEHGDHVRALPLVRQREPDVPIYMTRGTRQACGQDLSLQFSTQRVEYGVPFSISGVRVTPFPVDHDAKEPVGYRFDIPGFSIALATDLGVAKQDVQRAVSGCDVLLLEANYDVQMLRSGKYPGWLKGRVSSARGHLSNHQAKLLLEEALGPNLKHVVLIHLSEENNLPELALDAVRGILGGESVPEITVAPRHEPGPLLQFEAQGELKSVELESRPRQGQLPF